MLRLSDDLERERHVLEDRLVREELEVLEDGAEVAPQVRDLPRGELPDVLAGHVDLAPGGLLLLQEEPQEGGLPGAGGTHHEHELALADVDVGVIEGDDGVLVGLGDVLALDHGV